MVRTAPWINGLKRLGPVSTWPAPWRTGTPTRLMLTLLGRSVRAVPHPHTAPAGDSNPHLLPMSCPCPRLSVAWLRSKRIPECKLAHTWESSAFVELGSIPRIGSSSLSAIKQTRRRGELARLSKVMRRWAFGSTPLPHGLIVGGWVPRHRAVSVQDKPDASLNRSKCNPKSPGKLEVVLLWRVRCPGMEIHE